MILIIILYALIASTFILAKFALQYAQPFFLIGFRMVIAGFILLGYQRFFTHKPLAIFSADRWLFLKTALFHIYLAFILEFWALQKLSSYKTNLIFATTPFISALLAYLILKEALTIKKVISLIIGIGGLVPMIIAQTSPTEVTGEFLYVSYREAALLISVVSGAYAWFLVKELMEREYSLLLINGIAMVAGGFLALITSGISEVLLPYSLGTMTPLIFEMIPFLLWTGLLIIVANIIVYNLYGWLIKKYSITFLMFAGFLSPTFGGILGELILNEHITVHFFISLGMITFALYLFYTEELRIKAIRKMQS